MNVSDWSAARAAMLLDPSVANLNTGSFGPTPRVVFDRATFDFYLDLANLTLTREIVALQIQEGATTPTQVGFRIPLPSLGVHAEW